MAFSDPKQVLLTSDEMDARIAARLDGELQVELLATKQYICIDQIFKITHMMYECTC